MSMCVRTLKTNTTLLCALFDPALCIVHSACASTQRACTNLRQITSGSPLFGGIWRLCTGCGIHNWHHILKCLFYCLKAPTWVNTDSRFFSTRSQPTTTPTHRASQEDWLSPTVSPLSKNPFLSRKAIIQVSQERQRVYALRERH
jgi:hypothetical protein